MTKELLIKLGWFLLEQRVRYYKYDSPTLEDLEYDRLEKLYLHEAKIINLKTNIENMVGINENLESVKSAIQHVDTLANMQTNWDWINYKQFFTNEYVNLTGGGI